MQNDFACLFERKRAIMYLRTAGIFLWSAVIKFDHVSRLCELFSGQSDVTSTSIRRGGLSLPYLSVFTPCAWGTRAQVGWRFTNGSLHSPCPEAAAGCWTARANCWRAWSRAGSDPRVRPDTVSLTGRRCQLGDALRRGWRVYYIAGDVADVEGSSGSCWRRRCIV